MFNFGKYPKTKYQLFINKTISYSFVTTIRSEEQSVQALKEIATNSAGKYTRSYIITKTVANETTVLLKGSIKGSQ